MRNGAKNGRISYAWVDGANDVKLFEICGLGIAYRAQDLVKDLATTTLDEKDLTKVLDIIRKHYRLEESMAPATPDAT